MLQQNQKTFEQVRDHIRRALEVDNYNYFRFGQFSSISTLWDHILRTPEAMRTTYYQCENGHKDRIMYEKTCAYSIGVNTNRCTTMSQWIASQPDLSFDQTNLQRMLWNFVALSRVSIGPTIACTRVLGA